MNDSYRVFIETVRTKSDIVALVSDYVSLKKRGNKYWGCCPFHQEKTASFSVTPDKGLFYCFGCSTGGDAISFVQKIENSSFKDAVITIANKFGIEVPEQHKSSYQMQKDKITDEIYKVNDLAVSYFTACLEKTKFGQTVLAYLKDRGISQEVIEKFSLGASLPNWDSLYIAFSKRDIDANLMVKARLVASRSNEGYYDVFRSRLMIPIKNPRGKIVGFGGRIVGDGQPKYLNTAESDWFNKRFLLYGMDLALESIKQSGNAIVVEGYMDVIALHSHGITNAVASLGTAFAQEQAKLLKRVTKEVIFCYDSDLAGQEATMRAISIARQEELNVKAIMVSDGKDPDEFIMNNGKEAFINLLKNAKEGFDYQKDFILSKVDFSTLAGKVEVVSNILPIIVQLNNDIERKNKITFLAQKLVIDESSIISELNKYLKKNNKNTFHTIKKKSYNFTSEEKSLLERAQMQLIQAIIEKNDVLKDIENEVEMVGFSNDSLTQIYEAVKMQVQRNFSREELFAQLQEKEKNILTEILVSEVEYSDIEKNVEDCLKQMKKAYLEKQYNIHNSKAVEYERLGDSRFLQELAKSQEIQHEIKKLF